MNQINVWHLPLLADPGPAKLAIQLALLSSRICLSILPATSLLLAASLALGVITPIPIDIQYASLSLTIFMNSMHSVFESLLYGIFMAFIMINVVGHSLHAFGAHFFANEKGLQCSLALFLTLPIIPCFFYTLLGYPVRWAILKLGLLAIFTMR